MLFHKRTINTAAELNFCLAICRVIKVSYISILIAILLTSTHIHFETITLEAVTVLSLSCFIVLALTNILAHIKKIEISDLTDEVISKNPIKASIWEIYKADGPSISEDFNISNSQ